MTYDCIVIGCGGIGSAALYHAALRGWRVLGIDQYGPAHNKGSSHGLTRVIRKAYFEHPNYVPLAEEAYVRWDELNKRHRTRPSLDALYEETGILQIGSPDSEVIVGVEKSAAEHELPLQYFTADEISQRLPILKVPTGHVGRFEPNAGFLRVEQCVAAYLAQAKRNGAEFLTEQHVRSWHSENGVIKVVTSSESFTANRLIVAAGPWSSQMLDGIGIQLTTIAKQQHWYQLDRVEQKRANEFPIVFMEQDDGEQFYCIPELDALGMKVGRHTGGVEVTPENFKPEDIEVNRDGFSQFLNGYFHHTRHRLVHHSVCRYTMSPDSHFVVDRHPEHANVAFAAGLSGHGFKFAPVIGNRLVDMVDGEEDPKLKFLSLARFATSS